MKKLNSEGLFVFAKLNQEISEGLLTGVKSDHELIVEFQSFDKNRDKNFNCLKGVQAGEGRGFRISSGIDIKEYINSFEGRSVLILGSTGSGQRYIAKELLVRDRYKEHRIMVIDDEQEYEDVADQFSGSRLAVTELENLHEGNLVVVVPSKLYDVEFKETSTSLMLNDLRLALQFAVHNNFSRIYITNNYSKILLDNLDSLSGYLEGISVISILNRVEKFEKDILDSIYDYFLAVQLTKEEFEYLKTNYNISGELLKSFMSKKFSHCLLYNLKDFTAESLALN